MRFAQIADQIRSRSVHVDDVVTGATRFALGLCKKVLVADSVAPLADAAFAPGAALGVGDAWIGMLAYGVQIYFDFSGYSDMAIGIGRIFGFSIPENFRRPYTSVSVTDFWRRWHITLTSWFRDYVYIPLGGSRTTTAKTYRNLITIFVLTGVWHGASFSFLVCGLYHGAMLIFERQTGLREAPVGTRALLTRRDWAAFSDALVDRFSLRDLLIPLGRRIGYAMPAAERFGDVVTGADDWLFYWPSLVPTGEDPEAALAEAEAARVAMLAFLERSRAARARVNVLIAPDKASIHPEKLSGLSRRKFDFHRDSREMLQRSFARAEAPELIDIWSIYRNARAESSTPIYEAQGTHHTVTTSFRMAQAIVDAARPGVWDPDAIVPRVDPADGLPPVHVGDLAEMAGLLHLTQHTVTTSFAAFGPVVSGTTTSLLTVGGVYDGAQGDDTLTFEFRQNSNVGSGSKLDVWVDDGAGRRIEILRFEGVDADTPLNLSNGLTMSLGTGNVGRNGTFTVQVSATVGSQVGPTKPFDGIRNDQPNFELGTSVIAGSFEINGAVINVAANDSVDSVLAKINASSAGVTASYDPGTDSVSLIQDTSGQTPTIVLANDTSNFLAATKLAGATLVPGEDTTLSNNPISQVPALSGVGDGNFLVSGVVISIDTAVDSLDDVVARINASTAGASVVLDPDTSLLSIRSLSLKDDLVLDDGTSGFFTAIGITPAIRHPVVRQPISQSGFERLPAVEKDLRDLRKVLNALFSPTTSGIPELALVRDQLRDAVKSSFESLFDPSSRSVLRSGFGLGFDFTQARDVVQIDRERFEKASIQSFDALHEFLFLEGTDGESQGLVPSLLAATSRLMSIVDGSLRQLDPKGRTVDLRA